MADANFGRLIELALPAAGFAAIATHDESAIDFALDVAARNGVSAGARYEVQMLYGIRPQLQHRLLARGVPLRLLVRTDRTGSRISCDD
jgi:proline dehydrogenase